MQRTTRSVGARCGEERRLDQFAWRQKEKGKRHPYCRACMAAYNRAHYQANRELYIQRARARAEAVRRERIEYLLDYFRTHPCLDCGETDPVVLDFDHLNEKAFNISEGVRDRSWQAFLAEIAKCEVVCANCHRRRTARRGGWARAVAAARLD